MKEYLRQQRHWLREERLPGYAPDLNPVETLWGNIKGQELANRCAEDLAEADRATRRGMARCGEISKGKSWPIAVRRIWPKRIERPGVAWRECGVPPDCRFPF